MSLGGFLGRMMQAAFPPLPNPFAPFGGQAMPGLEAGAARHRMAPFIPAQEHVNTLLRNAGDTTLARARWLTRNNGYARAALRSWATATVGAGIKPSSLIEDAALKSKVLQTWADWTDESDAEGLTDLYGVTRRVSRETFLAGECFVRFIPRRSETMTVPMQLQVLPSEQLPYWKTEQAPDGRPIRLGIEFNAFGARSAYWFWRDNPADATLSFSQAYAANQVVRIPAREILHVFDPIEAGQLRGLSGYAAAMVKMLMMDLYDDAELERKKQAARFAAFITKQAPDFSNPNLLFERDPMPDDVLDWYGPGAVVNLQDGEDVKFSEPADVGPNYEGFQYRTLLQLCAALGVPYAELSYDLTKATYASSRAGLLAFRGDIEAFQHSVLVFQFIRPVYERWMRAAVLSGALPITAARFNAEARQLTRFKAITPRAPWVDPLKDRQAEALAVQNGFKSRSDVIEAEGYDAEEVDQRIAEDRARERRLGLDFTPVTRVAGAPHQTMPGGDSAGREETEGNSDRERAA